MILVCGLWLVVGLVTGFVAAFFALGTRIHNDRAVRLHFFKQMVARYPLDYEAALHAHDLMHPVASEPHVADRNAHFDPIDFKVCKHCGLPWPLADGVLEGHTQIDSRGKIVAAVCPGSGTKEYRDGEAW